MARIDSTPAVCTVSFMVVPSVRAWRFMHINTTTIVVNFIHNGTSEDEFTARHSVCCHFTVRPSAASGWTDGGANEST